ncbi:MAG: NAD(P)-dependent oxidoreductase [Deltaproteobacteria bacterium RBG_16_49_23]|nr:MAG: NAD(P)-dependent oxidoreductase [Deltaproteobacteria bacterium RBG_16_49_23]
MANRILVTGATGNIGLQIVKQLSVLGENVRAAVHSAKNVPIIKEAGAEPVELDFNRPETLRDAFRGIEKVYLLTPLVPNMVEMGAHLVEEAKKGGVKYIVRSSGLGADIEPGITLSRWHREIEKMIEASGIPYTFLRPNSFMQNYANLFGYTIKTQNAFYLPVGDGKAALVDVRDIAAAAAAVLTKSGHENRAYNLTGPEALSNHEVAEILSKVTGRKINYVNVSEDDARRGMREAGMPEVIVEALIELYAIQRAGYTAALSPDVERVTGKKPMSFNQFATDYVEAFK